jgi:uncharacterized protein YukE
VTLRETLERAVREAQQIVAMEDSPWHAPELEARAGDTDELDLEEALNDIERRLAKLQAGW